MATAVKATACQNPSRAAANSPSAPIAERFHGRYVSGRSVIAAARTARRARARVIGLNCGSAGDGIGSPVTGGLRFGSDEWSGINVGPAQRGRKSGTIEPPVAEAKP